MVGNTNGPALAGVAVAAAVTHRPANASVVAGPKLPAPPVPSGRMTEAATFPTPLQPLTTVSSNTALAPPGR